MKKKEFFIFCLVVLLVGICVSVWLFMRGGGEKPCYEVVGLPVPGGLVFYYVNSINDCGQVAGHFERSSGEQVAYIWDEENGFVELPEVDGKSCYVTDINNKGQAVGHYSDSETDAVNTYVSFFRDTDGEVVMLPGDYNTISIACGINDNEEIVGVISRGRKDEKGRPVKCVFMLGKSYGMRIIDEIEGHDLNIAGINESGQIAGEVYNADGHHGFFWSESSGLALLDINVWKIFGIDESGNVLGALRKAGERVFIWNESTGTKMLDGFPDDSGYCMMNDKGDIVGSVIDGGVYLFNKIRILSARQKPFLYRRDGKTVWLDELFDKGNLFEPKGINNDGWIVGDFFGRSGFHGVLLRPE